MVPSDPQDGHGHVWQGMFAWLHHNIPNLARPPVLQLIIDGHVSALQYAWDSE